MWFILALAFAGTFAAAQDNIYTNPDLIDGFEYGLVCDTNVVGSAKEPDTDIGEINIISGTIEFSTSGTLVPVIPGLSFGVKTRAMGDVNLDDVIFHVTHPPLIGTGTTKQSWQGFIDANRLSAQLYSFDLPSELVTGIWTLAAYQGDTLLYRISFDVIAPEDAPTYLKELCNIDAYTS
ncbi:DUF3859 domain-containing protein [Profundibacter sp.]|uniref:DUF3859 domain-containing protein n=1 Tax=Profundibacter sp. TaxID=3101071 RepID=UPI003D09E0DB